MKLWTLMLVTVFVANASGRADTIHRAGGQTLQGQVVGYWNMMFEVKAADGTVQRLPQSQVERITFETRPALLDTRNQGKVQGQLRTFENAAFQLQSPEGNTVTLPATFVKELSFSDGKDAQPRAALSANAAASGSSRKVEKINNKGARVDVARHLVAGQVTIVDFYADWCPPCRQIAPFLEQLAERDPEVYLRKVDIEKWGSPVAEQYKINSIPRIEIYDRQGRPVPLTGRDREAAIRNAVAKAKESK